MRRKKEKKENAFMENKTALCLTLHLLYLFEHELQVILRDMMI